MVEMSYDVVVVFVSVKQMTSIFLGISRFSCPCKVQIRRVRTLLEMYILAGAMKQMNFLAIKNSKRNLPTTIHLALLSLV